ncbi:Imm1 family immunity protein [Lentzea sp. NPDC058436]|uniref:Imm1 family immunity protein n=1 Tax=Lentzea sp. NPDC058436 TaxID=3346499 RepID=UPI00365C5736
MRALPADADLLAEFRTLNDQPGTPRMFALVLEEAEDSEWGAGPSVWLNAGFGGETGLLRWVDDSGFFAPTSAHTADTVTYLDPHGELAALPKSLQVPIEQVFAAVTEVLRTRSKPTCVDWSNAEAAAE